MNIEVLNEKSATIKSHQQMVHREIEFNQENWLKQYIELNKELKTRAKLIFEKDLFQLISNSVFGKTIENISKHRDSILE